MKSGSDTVSRDYGRCVLFGGQEGKKNRKVAKGERKREEQNGKERKGKEKGEVAVAGLRYWPLSWKG